MKSLVFFSVLIFALIAACGKVKKLEPEISFRKYSPYLTLNPVDSVSLVMTNNCEEFIPYPSDSVESLTIDVDSDGVDDFEFTYATFYEYQNSVDSCQNYNSSISIQAIGNFNKIIVEDQINYQATLFDKGKEIENTGMVSDSAILLLDHYTASAQFPLTAGNKYLGVRLNNNKMAWIKVAYHRVELSFSVMEHAYNDNFHLGITAGSLE